MEFLDVVWVVVVLLICFALLKLYSSCIVIVLYKQYIHMYLQFQVLLDITYVIV